MTPAISVIMAAYNGATLLPATLESLERQRFGDFEVLVVDDCSTDGTRDLVAGWRDPRVRLIALDANGGPVRARNRAVAEARGRYLAALDHDDLCHPDRFAAQVAYLERHPGTVLVASDVRFIDEDGGGDRASTYPAITTPGLIDWLLTIENPLVWSSCLIRGDAARALAPFTRTEIEFAEDFDLYQRLRPAGAIARLDQPLVSYRVHAGSVSHRRNASMRTSAAAVLADRHAERLGLAEARRVAALLVAHVMGGGPVADAATHAELGRILATLQAHHLDVHQPDATDRRLIKWETARRWARIGRAGLRTGTLTLPQVAAARPSHLGLGYAGAELLWSDAIGRARRMRQTLAAKIIRPTPNRANT